MRTADLLFEILLIAGGLNCLMVGAFETDPVARILGTVAAPLAWAAFIFVSLAALWQACRLLVPFADRLPSPERRIAH